MSLSNSEIRNDARRLLPRRLLAGLVIACVASSAMAAWEGYERMTRDAVLGKLSSAAAATPLDLKAKNFSDLDLHAVDFKSANLSSSVFNGANLRDANLDHANLTVAFFEGADLSHASFRMRCSSPRS